MRKLLMVALLLVPLAVSRAQSAGEGAHPGVDAFNRSFADATRHMDNAATMALWAEDGVSLLPATAPIVGKPAIAAFIERVTAQFPGARMKSFDLACSGIEVSGDMASEWCDEHQVVEMGAGKPPFDGRGKMLLVLRRGAGGGWLIVREMWNQGVAGSGTRSGASA